MAKSLMRNKNLGVENAENQDSHYQFTIQLIVDFCHLGASRSQHDAMKFGLNYFSNILC